LPRGTEVEFEAYGKTMNKSSDQKNGGRWVRKLTSVCVDWVSLYSGNES
jgi:hypothetical protein